MLGGSLPWGGAARRKNACLHGQPDEGHDPNAEENHEEEKHDQINAEEEKTSSVEVAASQIKAENTG